MHSLGFDHMRQRPDRDNYVNIESTKIMDNDKHNFELSPTSKTFTPYDFSSVLHYSSGDKIIPKNRLYFFTTGAPFPSFFDILSINELYNCKKFCPPLNCQNGGYANPRNCHVCNCPSGYGGALCDRLPEYWSQNLSATAEWTDHTMVPNSDLDPGYIRTNFHHTALWINAPKGKKIQVKVTLGRYYECTLGCSWGAVEVKLNKDHRETGPRFCCSAEVDGKTFTSELNPLPIVVYGHRKAGPPVTTISMRYIN